MVLNVILTNDNYFYFFFKERIQFMLLNIKKKVVSFWLCFTYESGCHYTLTIIKALKMAL